MSLFKTPADLVVVIQALRMRVAVLERTKVTHGSGPPPTGATEPYVDDTNSKLYFKVGGTWKAVTLA